VSGTQSSRHMLRSIGAVFAGLVAVFILALATDELLQAAKIFPPFGQTMSGSLFLLATIYRTAYSIVGGYITARLAFDKPVKHAVILGVIGFVLGTAGALATWRRGPEFGPHWYPLALVVLAIPSSWAGGWLRSKNSPSPAK
jgi:hypothetical protein